MFDNDRDGSRVWTRHLIPGTNVSARSLDDLARLRDVAHQSFEPTRLRFEKRYLRYCSHIDLLLMLTDCLQTPRCARWAPSNDRLPCTTQVPDFDKAGISSEDSPHLRLCHPCNRFTCCHTLFSLSAESLVLVPDS